MPLVQINTNNFQYSILEVNWARLIIERGRRKWIMWWTKKKTHGVTWKCSNFGWIIPTLKERGLEFPLYHVAPLQEMKTSTFKPHLLLMPSHVSLSLLDTSTHNCIVVYCMSLCIHVCMCLCVLDFTHLLSLCPLPLLYPPYQLLSFWSFSFAALVMTLELLVSLDPHIFFSLQFNRQQSKLKLVYITNVTVRFVTVFCW